MTAIDGRALQDYQRMMADKIRMQAYEKAIGKICPGKVVCEIGVGLGPLSLMALKAGAAKVYGFEIDAAALDVATELIRSHGFDESRFVPILGSSSQGFLPERVDVILSETLDSIGLGENTAFYMYDAYQRFLKPGGCFIPQELECWMALAKPANYESLESFWSESMKIQYDLDFRPAIDALRNCKLTFPIKPEEVLSDWYCWQRINFNRPNTYPNQIAALLKSSRSTESPGLAYAFNALLAPGISIRTFPNDPLTHWQQGFTAFTKPISLELGDVVYLELDMAETDRPSQNFRMRVISGPESQVQAFLREQYRTAA